MADNFRPKDFYETSTSLLNDLLRCRRNSKFIFRGTSRLIETQPHIARRNLNGVSIASLELKYLYNFYKYAIPYINRNYDTLDYVACAQHYGVPTRFLDWTRDPFVALFFAVSNNEKPDDEIYKIYYTKLEENIVIDKWYGASSESSREGSDFLLRYINFIELIKDKKELCKNIEKRYKILNKYGIVHDASNSNGMIIFDPPTVNERLIAQKGLFSIPQSIQGNAASNEIERHCDCIKIKLNPYNYNRLLEQLDNMDYSLVRLFPEIGSIERYVNKRLSEEADISDMIEKIYNINNM